MDVVFELQGVTTPVQLALQLQPYSDEHVVDVVFAAQDFTVPVQVPGFHVQPLWYEHIDDEVIEAQGVSVPVQDVDQVQPALPHRVDEA